ncbi:MAG: ABC transporter permease [Anaerolineae bacterium]|nr:ABC transporter permease [Anaerolineae bacterium]
MRTRILPSDSPLAQAWREILRNRIAVVAFLLLVAIILSALFAHVLTPYDPIGRDAKSRLQAPSLEHPFGTDALGRDILGRILHGGRVSLQVGFVSVILSTVVGVPLGLIAGYVGGRTDNLIMRLMDVILAFPGLILAIWLVSMLGASMGNMIIAISVFSVPTYARMTRGVTLSTREMEYVVAARSMGARSAGILFWHILPSVAGPLIVLTTLSISGAIVTGASLSFLGLGVRPPTPEWGAMLSDGRGYMRNAWWMSVFPGLAITLVVLAANVLGDGLRDALDPKTRRR